MARVSSGAAILTAKFKKLAKATFRGEHAPKSAALSSSGLERLRRVAEREVRNALTSVEQTKGAKWPWNRGARRLVNGHWARGWKQEQVTEMISHCSMYSCYPSG